MEYKCKEGAIDNRKVHDTHQEGIKRVIQRHHNKLDSEGHSGSMAGGWKHGGEGKKDHFKRSGGSLTPTKA